MFTDINNLLNLKDCLISRYLIGICECKCDGSFLIHHFLSYLLKNKHSVVLLSFSQSLNHFTGVGNKIGINLVSAKSEGSFVFIEGLKRLGQAVTSGIVKVDTSWLDKEGRISVRTLCNDLKASISEVYKNTSNSPVLIIDNVNVLVDIGMKPQEVANVVEQLYKFVSGQCDGGLIVGVNNDLGEKDDDADFLKKYIQHMSTMSIEVKGLETGYCKDVHGQMTVTWRDTTSREKWPRKQSQFKLTDKNCILFASGMSSAVL